jgi:1-deoxy-D-xylulose-5-phosphate reductoisomerase
MLIPIALGMAWPDRVPDTAPAVDWTRPQAWEFFPLDDDAFPAVRLAREVGARAGTAPAVYNAANEVCVAAFRDGRLPFTGIVDTVAAVVQRHGEASGVTGRHVGSTANDLSLDDVLAADAWARDEARHLLETHR